MKDDDRILPLVAKYYPDLSDEELAAISRELVKTVALLTELACERFDSMAPDMVESDSLTHSNI